MNVGDVIFAGTWTVRRVLGGPGQSGMGIIYVVDDGQTKTWALKTIQDELYVDNPRAMERFRREAYLWINLGLHPNVTGAYLVVPHYKLTGQGHSSKPHIVLEYVSGGDLASWIGTSRLQDVNGILRLALQFCDGMTYALSHGICVHRDIKPANCLMTEDGTLKVTDFGLVKAFAELARVASRSVEHDRTVGGAGTPPYMAPEQFRDASSVDVRADIYSFGIMLYEMVTGVRPFAGRTWDEFELAHARTAPPRVTRDAEIDDIVQTCLQKDPTRRFSDFSALRQSLAAAYERGAGKPAPQPMVGTTPEGFHHWNFRGQSLLDLGMYEESLVWFERALGPPNDPTVISADFRCHVLTDKGKALFALKRLNEALAAFDLALEENPQELETVQLVWADRADVLLRLGRTDEAIASWDAALHIPRAYPQGWCSKGDVFYEIDRYQDALTCYSRAIELEPGSSEYWQKLGGAYAMLERIDDALNAFGRAIELDPENALAWVSKATTLLQKNQTDEALQCCDQALSLQADNARAHAWKGWILYNVLNRPAEALPHLERAAADGHEKARDLLEECQRTLNTPSTESGVGELPMARLLEDATALLGSDPTAAYKKLSDLAAINPQSFPAWYYRGHILSRANRCADALPLFLRAAGIDPASFDVWCELGEVHLGLRRWDEAVVNFQRALTIDGASLRARNDLGNALFALDRNEEALAEFDLLLCKQPDHDVALYMRASALLALSRYAEALPAVDRALAVDGKNSLSRLLRARILAGMNRFSDALASLDCVEDVQLRAEIESLRSEILQQLEAASKPQTVSEKRSFAGIKLTRLTAFLFSFITSAIVLVAGAGALATDVFGSQAERVLAVSILASIGALLVRVYFGRWYARDKGRVSQWGLFAAFGVAGWLILWLLADYRKPAPARAGKLA